MPINKHPCSKCQVESALVIRWPMDIDKMADNVVSPQAVTPKDSKTLLSQQEERSPSCGHGQLTVL